MTDKKETISKKIAKFLVPEDVENLERQVADFDNLANYNIMTQSIENRTVLTNLRDVPSMLYDPVIKAALSAVMNTAFQTDSNNKIFHTKCEIDSVLRELEAFHESIDAQNLILLIGYNLLLWGQIPFKHCFNKDDVLERVMPIADFTRVTPIIISGKTVGFMCDGEFHPSYEFTYAQTSYFKNLGGNSTSNMLLYSGSNDFNEFTNEFVYADSYLSTCSKPWRNIQIIEDALLLTRMDQSNYYRIISVNVGGNVYSKSAIRVLNFYRNLFKKVRRISYDAQGMASKGSGQNFEIIVPKTENQGVEIQDVGGSIDVKALEDLDKQYQKLFAALQIQPSMIGYSDDVPSSLGDSTAITFDRRFAKVCKTYSVAAFEALRNIDYLHLRSKGFNVSKSDWSYGTVNSQIQDEQERGEVLQVTLDNYKSLVEVMKQNNVEFDANYLTKTLLGGSLSSFGVDVDKMLNVGSAEEDVGEDRMLGASFRDGILKDDAHAMALCGVFEEKEAEQIFSSLCDSEKRKDYFMREKISPIGLKELCSSVAVNADRPLDLTGYVIHVDSTEEEIESMFSKKSSVEEMRADEFSFPIMVSSGTKIDVRELSAAQPGVVNSLYIDRNGNRYITSKRDLLTYLSNYLNDGLDVYCKKIIRET